MKKTVKLIYIVWVHLTLEQARTLAVFAREGSLAAAARALHRTHSAVLYGLRQLEEQCGLSLLDRSGYRTVLTERGIEVLKCCDDLLEAEANLIFRCEILRQGWEPVLSVVFDAVYPLAPVLEVVRMVSRTSAPTRVRLQAAALAQVEERFVADKASLMISILPTALTGVTVLPLRPIEVHLVAHRDHALAGRKRLVRDDLNAFALLTVQGSDPRLRLPAERDVQSAVALSDFHAKKAAILAGIGYGWLPDWLTEEERARGELQVVDLEEGNVHAFHPHLVHREPLGPAGRMAVAHFAGGP